MYNYVDLVRFFSHSGPKRIFWCGGDILRLEQNPFRGFVSHLLNGYKNYCENSGEQKKLKKLGVTASIAPMIFDDFKSEIPTPWVFPVKNTIHLFTTLHKYREDEYGLKRIYDLAAFAKDIHFHIYGIKGSRKLSNVTYHGFVENDQFNEEIKKYHGALRLNEFDGFSESLAKSSLLGQYPVSIIEYPHVISPAGKKNKSLVNAIRRIAKKKGPNETGRDYWKKTLDESLNRVLNGE